MRKTAFFCGLVMLVFSAKGIAQLDPSIPLRVNPPRGVDVAESMKKALEIKRMQLENEAIRQEIERRARESAAQPTPSQPTVAAANPPAVDHYPVPPGGSMESLVHQCDINREASPVNAMEFGQCLGYFSGTMNSILIFAGVPRKEDFPICLPPTGISVNEAVKVFQKWASDHPQWLHEDAGVHVVLSLMQAFPCTSPPETH